MQRSRCGWRHQSPQYFWLCCWTVLLIMLLVLQEYLQLATSPPRCFPASLCPKQGEGPRLASHATRSGFLSALPLCSPERYIVVDITRNTVTLWNVEEFLYFLQLYIYKVKIRLHFSVADKEFSLEFQLQIWKCAVRRHLFALSKKK